MTPIEILNGLVGGEGYMGAEWWALPMEEKAEMQENAIYLSREWYEEEYGEEYPLYPGNSPGQIPSEAAAV